LENIWRDRVDIALERYRLSRDECRRAIEEHYDAAQPDGSFAYTKALRAETAALAEYRRVLAILNDLTLSGKMPPAE
jgi:hypothetical protein